MKIGEVFVHCQQYGLALLFYQWINEIFIPYQKLLSEKCILIIDRASCHISNESLNFIKEKDINYVLIPAGRTPESQALDISINKIFKNNIKIKFKENRSLFEKLEKKFKLQTARINLLDYIQQIWYNDSIINNTMIKNGFNHAGIINNFYLIEDEKK